MFGRAFGKALDPEFLIPVAIVALAVITMVRRNVFKIQKITG